MMVVFWRLVVEYDVLGSLVVIWWVCLFVGFVGVLGVFWVWCEVCC